MKKLLIVLFTLLLTACSSGEGDKSELLLNDEKINLKENKIVFGDKVNGKVDLDNLFSLNENVYFVILLTNKVGKDSITIQLNKLSNDKWVSLTNSKLNVKRDSREIMNGLPGSIFEKVGTGSYQLVAKTNDKTLAKGEFVIKKQQE